MQVQLVLRPTSRYLCFPSRDPALTLYKLGHRTARKAGRYIVAEHAETCKCRALQPSPALASGRVDQEPRKLLSVPEFLAENARAWPSDSAQDPVRTQERHAVLCTCVHM